MHSMNIANEDLITWITFLTCSTLQHIASRSNTWDSNRLLSVQFVYDQYNAFFEQNKQDLISCRSSNYLFIVTMQPSESSLQHTMRLNHMCNLFHIKYIVAAFHELSL